MQAKDIKQMQKIIKIVDNYFNKGADILKSGGENKDIGAADKAEKYFNSGLYKLKRMKLTSENKKDFNLLLNAIEYAIKATKAIKERKFKESEEYSLKSTEYAKQYGEAVVTRARRL